GTTSCLQFDSVFQSPLVGLIFHAALPAKVVLRQERKSSNNMAHVTDTRRIRDNERSVPTSEGETGMTFFRNPLSQIALNPDCGLRREYRMLFEMTFIFSEPAKSVHMRYTE